MMHARRRLLVTAFLALAVGWGRQVVGQQEMDILPLRHRTPDQVLPILLPLVESGGTLTGANNQLFLRASRRNREEIRRALEAIDKPLRRLIVRVRQADEGEEARQGASLSGTFGTSRARSANGQVWDTRNLQRDQAGQAVQTIEGGRAYIRIGQSIPVPMRQVVMTPHGVVVSEGAIFRDLGQGFHAEPRLLGDQVTVEISQQQDAQIPGTSAGATQQQRLMTTVSGRLGEWMLLGGSEQQSGRDQRGGWSVSSRDMHQQRQLWLMVEEVR